MIKLLKHLFGTQKKQLDNPIDVVSNIKKTKIVKVKIKYSYQFDDIEEEVSINVPIGLSEDEEDKFIDFEIGRNYAYLYGR